MKQDVEERLPGDLLNIEELKWQWLNQIHPAFQWVLLGRYGTNRKTPLELSEISGINLTTLLALSRQAILLLELNNGTVNERDKVGAETKLSLMRRRVVIQEVLRNKLTPLTREVLSAALLHGGWNVAAQVSGKLGCPVEVVSGLLRQADDLEIPQSMFPLQYEREIYFREKVEQANRWEENPDKVDLPANPKEEVERLVLELFRREQFRPQIAKRLGVSNEYVRLITDEIYRSLILDKVSNRFLDRVSKRVWELLEKEEREDQIIGERWVQSMVNRGLLPIYSEFRTRNPFCNRELLYMSSRATLRVSEAGKKIGLNSSEATVYELLLLGRLQHSKGRTRMRSKRCVTVQEPAKYAVPRIYPDDFTELKDKLWAAFNPRIR